MSVIALTKFAGVAPRNAPYALPAEMGQVAIDCAPYISLKPLRDNTVVKSGLTAGDPSSIYKFGGAFGNDTLYWFHWPSKIVDVVPGAISGDVTERTFFVEDGVAKVTNATLALTGGSGDYPWNSYNLGVPFPTQTPDVSVGGSGDPLVVESRTYVYTFVTSSGEESMPSDASIIVDVEVGQSVTVSNMQTVPTAGHDIVAKRIYRSLTGSGTSFNFVEEVAVATASYIDTKLDEELGEVCPSIEWAPVPALTGMFGMANGMIIGFKGKDVIPLEAYRPFAAPEGYRLATEYDIVGGVAIGGTAAVLCTTGAPYLLAGNEPSSLSLQKIEIPQGCVSRESIAAVLGGAVFASPDGLIYVSPGNPPINLTEDLFKKEDWAELSPNTIRGYASEDRYIGFYDTGLAQGGFLFNVKTRAFIYLDFYATAGYNDPLQDELYLKVGTDIVKFESAATYRTYTWRSKVFTVAAHTNFAAGQVIAVEYPVTMRVIADGVQIHSETVANSDPFRLPANSRARNFEIELTGTREVIAAFISNSVAELKAV